MIKSNGGKHQSDPKVHTKDLFKYPSVAIILSSIALGMNTRDKLTTKNAKSAYEDLEFGSIPEGTFNKYQKLLWKEGFVYPTNEKDANLRKGDAYSYEINYERLYERLVTEFKKEVENYRRSVRKVIFGLRSRLEKTERKSKFFEKNASENKDKIAKLGKHKETYNFILERVYEDFLYRTEGHLKIDAKKLTTEEKEILGKLFDGLFLIMRITGESEKTMDDIVHQVFQHLKNRGIDVFHIQKDNIVGDSLYLGGPLYLEDENLHPNLLIICNFEYQKLSLPYT